MKYKTFAELLLEKELLTEEQANDVWAGVRLRKKDFPAVLYEKQFLPEKTVAENYAEFLNVDFIDLETFVIDPVIAKLIPKHIAERHQLVAINKIGLSLVIAMADSQNVIAVDDVQLITGLRVKAVIAAPAAINKGISDSYGN